MYVEQGNWHYVLLQLASLFGLSTLRGWLAVAPGLLEGLHPCAEAASCCDPVWLHSLLGLLTVGKVLRIVAVACTCRSGGCGS